MISPAPVSPSGRDTSRGGVGRPGALPIDTDSDPGSYADAMRFHPFDGQIAGWFHTRNNTGGDLPNSDERTHPNTTGE